MLKKILLAAVGMPFALAACASNSPSETEIRKALAEQVNQKGCATSVLFETMPIKEHRIAGNQKTLGALVNVGLLEKSGNTYALTSLGKATYDAKAKGFCYTDHYEIKNIAVVKEEDKKELSGSAVAGAWYITFTITPSGISDWAKNPQLLQAASLASPEKIAGEQKYTVRFAKNAGEDRVFIADPRFSFRPGIHFNASF